MPSSRTEDFQLRSLYEALDERRQERGLTWTGVTREINEVAIQGGSVGPRAISVSTVKGLRDKHVAEGDGVLQMLLWLGRPPESFVPGHGLTEASEAALPDVGTDRILRWDTSALHLALQAEREDRHLTWAQVACDIGCSPAQLTGLAHARRVGFPGVMRIVAWLGQPAARFTRPAPW